MKKFLLFAGEYYYPNGGMGDYIGDFDTIQEAKDALRNADWGQIVRHADMAEVATYVKPESIYPGMSQKQLDSTNRLNASRGWMDLSPQPEVVGACPECEALCHRVGDVGKCQGCGREWVLESTRQSLL